MLRRILVIWGTLVTSLITIVGCETAISVSPIGAAQTFLQREMSVPFSISQSEVLSEDSVSATVLIRGDVKTQDTQEPIPSESILWLENYGGEWRVIRHLPFRPLNRDPSPAKVSYLRLGEGPSCDLRTDKRGDIVFDDLKEVFVCFDFGHAENDVVEFIFVAENRILLWTLRHNPMLGRRILLDGSGSVSSPILDVSNSLGKGIRYTMTVKLNSADIDTIRFRVKS